MSADAILPLEARNEKRTTSLIIAVTVPRRRSDVVVVFVVVLMALLDALRQLILSRTPRDASRETSCGVTRSFRTIIPEGTFSYFVFICPPELSRNNYRNYPASR